VTVTVPRRDDAADGRRSGAQAIERSIAILRCFAGGAGDRGISDIAAQVQLGPSTVHRIVRALCDGGLLVQNPDTERYHLGPTTALLGQFAVDQLGFEGARRELEALVGATGESVNLGVRQAADVLVVMRIESAQPLRFHQEPGSRVPLHASAMGKALLAFSDSTPADAVAALPDLARVTGNTITNRRRLTEELERVRAQGYALNDEERNVGVRAAAAPVLDRRGVARAAIAVQGPTVRMNDARVDEVAKQAIAAAARVAAIVPLELL
jgi:IclR family transcriptional regulator, acetate operon repressor